MSEHTDLEAAIDVALRTIEHALANEMRTIDGASAESHLARLREELEAMRARGAVSVGELRTMIRAVATWAPADDVSLLGSLGVIAQARG